MVHTMSNSQSLPVLSRYFGLYRKQLRKDMKKPGCEISRLNAFEGYVKRMGITDFFEIDAPFISEFLDSLLESGKSTATRNRYRARLSGLFQFLLAKGWVQNNPVRATKALPENNIRTRILTKGEVKEFFLFLDAYSSPVHALALKLALLTGLRIGNIIELEWSWFNAHLTEIHIPRTKSGKPFTAHLAPPAIAVIKQLLALPSKHPKFVFPSSRRKQSYIAYPRSCFESALAHMESVGVLTAPFSIHDLRRTFASYQLHATGDIRAVQQSLGHSTIHTTERYAHHLPERLAERNAQGLSAMGL